MKKEIVNSLLFLLISLSVSAQTVNMVNTGTLFISKGEIFTSVSPVENRTVLDFASGLPISSAQILNNGNFYVYQGYINNGGTVMSDPSFVDSTFFAGIAGPQLIGGDSSIVVSNAIFENRTVPYRLQPTKPAYLLGNAMRVTSTLFLTSGIIDAASYDGSMTIEDQVIGASDSTYIFGTVIRPKPDKFTFPIGDAGYLRPLTKSKSAKPTDVFSASYTYADPGNRDKLDPSISLIDSSEYWTFSSNQTQISDTITINWDVRTTPASLIANSTGQWAIARWDTISSHWKTYKGIVDTLNQSISAVVDQSGTYTLARVVGIVSSITLNPVVPAIPIPLLCPHDSGGSHDYCGLDGDYTDPDMIGLDTMKSEALIYIYCQQKQQVQVTFIPDANCANLYKTSLTYDSTDVKTPLTSGQQITLLPSDTDASLFQACIVVDRDKFRSPNASAGYLIVQVSTKSQTKSQKILFSNDFDQDGFPNVIERSTCIKRTQGFFNEWYPTLPADDADGDGIPNVQEAGGARYWDQLYYVDTNGNCIPDFMDPDSNGNGVPDNNKKFTDDTKDTTMLVRVRQAISPNGDGLGDDHLLIEYITRYPHNELTLFNRLGKIIFKVQGYDNVNNVFEGYPNVGNTNKRVPMGTYYYYLRFYSDDHKQHEKSGFVEVRY